MDSGSNEQPPPHDQGQKTARLKADIPPSHTPIYWQHRRFESYASIGAYKPPPITLEDNTAEDADNIRSPLWARHVSIEGHVVITGSLPGVGDYTVWNCKIDTLDVSTHSRHMDCASISSISHVPES